MNTTYLGKNEYNNPDDVTYYSLFKKLILKLNDAEYNNSSESFILTIDGTKYDIYFEDGYISKVISTLEVDDSTVVDQMTIVYNTASFFYPSEVAEVFSKELH